MLLHTSLNHSGQPSTQRVEHSPARTERIGQAGDVTSIVEVTNVSIHGIWLYALGREQVLSYEDFPWLKDAPIRAIADVQEPTPGHFHWPQLDVDLCMESIEHPERFPFKADNPQVQ